MEDSGGVDQLIARAREHEASGQWLEAKALYGQLFDAAIAERNLALAQKALLAGSRTSWNRRSFEEAEDLAALALKIAELVQDRESMAKSLNMLATVHQLRDEFAEAEELYTHALEVARRMSSDELIANVCQNLGVMATKRGDVAAARGYFLEGIAAAVRSVDRPSLVRAYTNFGIVCCDLEDWMEAEIYFTRGIEIAQELGDAMLQAKLYVNRAEPQIRVGEFAQAGASLDAAEELAREAELQSILSNIARFRGIISRLHGDFASANRHLSRSLLLSAQARLKLERAEALEEMAELRRVEGKQEEALSLAREARQAYSALGATRDERRLDRRLAEWGADQPVADLAPAN